MAYWTEVIMLGMLFSALPRRAQIWIRIIMGIIGVCGTMIMWRMGVLTLINGAISNIGDHLWNFGINFVRLAIWCFTGNCLDPDGCFNG